jgi:phage N-6-adenine-methyltransferase
MTEQHGKEALNPDRSDNYNTPPEVVAHVHAFFGTDGIDLDPATSPDNPTDAHHFFTPADDGLSQHWQGYNSVFCNPPYKRRWYAKIADEVNAGATETIALLKASPCTNWAQEVILPPATAVCFVKGRLVFGGQTNAAGFGSWLVYFGSQQLLFNKVFNELGWVVPVHSQPRNG